MKKYETMADETLIRKLREGETEIADFIVDKYKFIVKKKAKQMFLLGGENDDLIQEGMIGLFKAIRDYDLEQQMSFSSFADLCISRQMYTAIKLSQRQKHMPLNSYVSLYEVSKQKEDENYDFRTYLKIHADPDELDQQFQELHQELFSEYDCSQCGNCCKKYHGNIPEEDIDQDASYIGMEADEFIDRYLEL